jgi:hypothetical protein
LYIETCNGQVELITYSKVLPEKLEVTQLGLICNKLVSYSEELIVNLEAARPSLVSCLQMFIQHIHSYSSYLEVISYIRAVIAQLVQHWATGRTIRVLGFDSWQGLGIFLFTTVSRMALGLTQPIQWVPGALSLGVKRPEREADHSPPSSAKVRNAWSYTSTPPLRLHGVVLS